MNADDPKFTAHVLGEMEDLTPAERAEIEALLASDSAAVAEAAETRALAARLRAELSAEAAAPLAEHQRAAVLEAAKTPVPTAKIVQFPRRATLLTMLAACAVVGISIGLVYQAMQVPVHSSLPLVAAVSSVPESLPTDLTKLVVQESFEQLPAQSHFASGPVSPVSAHPVMVGGAGAFQPVAGLVNAGTLTPVVPHLDASMATHANTFTGTTVLSTGVISVNGGVTTFSSSTITTFNSNVSLAQAPTVAGTNGGVLASGTVATADASNYRRWENQAGIEPAAAAFQLQDKDEGLRFPEKVTKAVPSPQIAALKRSVPAGGYAGSYFDTPRDYSRGFDTNAFDAVAENDFLAARDNPLSTFSADVDTASYAIVRRMLSSNQLPPKGAVRTEELLNYFTYEYPQPNGDAPFSATMEVAACPWEPEHRLVRVGLKGREVPRDQRPPSNLVFLIDVSGSMNMPNKLPLLQQAFRLLIEQLGPKDRVAIVTYAGATGIVLEPTQDKEAMQAAVDRLRAGGSTNGASGVQLAYQVAERSFIRGGTNRVILATDGDWNVGVTNQSDLLDMIAQKAKGGVFLTVLGFGMDNLKDSMLVKLADRGNGHYDYIDTPLEAKKVFVDQLSGTLVTIAKDVKLQVEFNPARVGAYRLIGYEKRLLAKEDFNNDKKDAGEIGAGHTVTALYEVVPAGKEMPPIATVDKLKYAALAPQPIPGANPVNKPVQENPREADGTAPDIHPDKPNPEPAQPEEKGGLNQINIVTTSDGRVTVTLDKAEADGSITHTLALTDRAQRVAETGDVLLYGMPDVTQGVNRCIATTPQTWIKLARNGQVEAHGPHRTLVVDRDRDRSKPAPSIADPSGLPASARNEMLTLKLRYKAPDGDKSTLLEYPLIDPGTSWDKSSRDFRFAAAVAGYGMLLQDSSYRGQATWESVAAWAHEGIGEDKSGYREEFLSLVKRAKELTR
ncbi:MAG: von Willebrand factor type A domain-containing protein [Chthoniobacter sp.]